MNLEAIRIYCLEKPGVSEGFPFDERVLVFKVCGKMFLLTDVERAESVNLKCDPEYAIELRERFSSVQPGYHMDKKHWNTVQIKGPHSEKDLFNWIDDSYNLVLKGIPKSRQIPV
jgi:predicted DNA-binding protein (MmcQ/YjbR family)